MSICPLFMPREDLKERPAWEGEIKANCGNSAWWDWDAGRCGEEEKLKKTEIKREV